MDYDLKTGNPFYPEPYLEGELKIGASNTPAITRKQLTQGMLIVGRSGAGKTNFMYYLINQFLESKLPVLSFDFTLFSVEC